MKKIDISIIIPVYNAFPYIERCLQSIVDNAISRIALQVIMIDDGSVDESVKMCEKYCKEYSYFELYRCSHQGVSHARNRGIEYAKGKYLLFVDADDYLETDSLAHLYDFAEGEGVPFVFADIQKMDFDGSIINRMWADDSCLFDKQDIAEFFADYLKEPRKNNLISFVWNKLFEHEIIEKNNIRFNEALHINEDALFVFEFLVQISKMGYLRETTYCYCTNQVNIGTNRMINNPLAFSDSLLVISNYLKENSKLSGMEIDRIYKQSFAELAVRNLFHIIRCYSGEIKQLRKIVKKVLNTSILMESMKVYRPGTTDNLRIVPTLIRLRMPLGLIFAFKLQIIMKKGVFTRNGK